MRRAALLVSALLLAAAAAVTVRAQPQPTPASGYRRSPASSVQATGTPPAGTGTPATPSGTPAAPVTGEPAAAETPAEPASDEPDVDALRQEYLKLRDRLFRSRARAAAVGNALFSTRLVVRLDYGSGRFYSIKRAEIRLDGATVFEDTEGVIAADTAPRFTGFVAPGRHLVSIRIEALGKDDDRFTSVVDNTFAMQAPAGKDVTVAVRARDDGDIPYRWRKSESGAYQVRLDVKVTTVARAKEAPRGGGKK